jgi:hypothetical protein
VFLDSSLQSIVIPRNVQFIDGSPFCHVELSSCDIESGNDRSVVEKECLIDILDHKLIRSFSNSSVITIPSHIEIRENPWFQSQGKRSPPSAISSCALFD